MPGYFLGLDTPLKKALFWGYVASWTVQGLAVHSALVHDGDAGANTLVDPDDEREEGLAYSGSSSGGRLMYNVTAMVILIEAVKLAASATMYMKFDYKSEAGFLPENWQKVFLYYFAPATLYAIYNNMVSLV